MRSIYGLNAEEKALTGLAEQLKALGVKNIDQITKSIKSKTKLMHKAAGNLDFEEAAKLRDEIKQLSEIMLEYSEEI
jgi:excinuclease ABC subunit B